MNIQLDKINSYFFVGIAGTGMSAIAQYLVGVGKKVSGSDRLFADGGDEIRAQFAQQGIECFNQDASGLTSDIDIMIVSTAIEESNIEYQKALELGIQIVKRSEILAAISASKRTIAVGGTSGKSTTTAMIFHILETCKQYPSLITGAGLSVLQKKGLLGNAWVGESDWLVIESDESDGSIVNYHPEIALLLNVDRDHHEFDTLLDLFSQFKKNTSQAFIVNQDHEKSALLSENIKNDFGYTNNAGIKAENFQQNGFSISFNVNGISANIPVVGIHNMENALAALAACIHVGVTLEEAVVALANFEGIYRRTQLVGEHNSICVVDDFAHNPAEVAAAIKACQNIGKRVLAWFQPHGFGPLRFMHQELAKEVAKIMSTEDVFYLSDVFYAGGTVTKDIQSDVVADEVLSLGKTAKYFSHRDEVKNDMIGNIQSGDVILLMGARDTTMSDFAKEVFHAITKV